MELESGFHLIPLTACYFAVPEVLPFDYLNPSEIDVLHYVYENIAKAVRPGVRTMELELLVEESLEKTGAEGYFRGYLGYPNLISASINEEILLTLPSPRELRTGDILTIQTGVKFAGRYAYLGWTFPVGEISEKRCELLDTARRAVRSGIAVVRDQAKVGDISQAMNAEIRNRGCSANAQFVGYRMGPQPTMPPQIPCSYPIAKPLARVETGMTLALIAVAHAGNADCRMGGDGWSVETTDRSDAALFSHLVQVEEDQGWVLTNWT